MAKDLPYFKFFCSEWNDGDITLENYEYQGLFINICSYYWSNECNVPFDKLIKKFRGFDEIIDDLNAAGLFKIDEDRNIRINFLDEQRDERLESSKNKSKGGKASAEARRLKKLATEKKQETNTLPTENEHLLKSCSTEVQVLRREEKREEEKRKEDTFYSEKSFLSDWNELRTKHLNKPSFCNRIGHRDSQDDFKELLKHYTREQFKNAMIGLFKQKEVPNGNEVMRSSPKHLLKDLEPYLTAFQDQNEYLYSKKKKIERL
ncbi:hypothetical protein [Croceibacter atlanticus]|uniref:hypothetical protein n=1 Tax=Croceibacter atlanticus TaxID=313588 RepID=UPI0030DBF39D